MKKEPTFYMSVHLHTLWKPQFGAKCGPRGAPGAIFEPIVSKGLRHDQTVCNRSIKPVSLHLQII